MAGAHVAAFPIAVQLLLMFVLRDFIQYWTHRLLHRVPVLWSFHKVHHSVEQMGFAAQLRFHWMETVVYRAVQYLPLAMVSRHHAKAMPRKYGANFGLDVLLRLSFHSTAGRSMLPEPAFGERSPRDEQDRASAPGNEPQGGP